MTKREYHLWMLGAWLIAICWFVIALLALYGVGIVLGVVKP